MAQDFGSETGLITATAPRVWRWRADMDAHDLGRFRGHPKRGLYQAGTGIFVLSLRTDDLL